MISEDDLKAMTDKVVEKYEGILARAKQIASKNRKSGTSGDSGRRRFGSFGNADFTKKLCKRSRKKSRSFPKVFTSTRKWSVNLRAAQKWERRSADGLGICRSVAIGSLVLDGKSVRLSGQDSGRGTFSQRHAEMYDT